MRGGFDVEGSGEFEAPIPGPVAKAPEQPLRRVACLQIIGVEVPGLSHIQREGDRPMLLTRIVGAVDLHRTCSIRMVDDPGETLPGRS